MTGESPGMVRRGGHIVWPLLLVGLVLCLDFVADAGSRSTAEIGALDEPAHLATGILVIFLLIAVVPAPPTVAFVLAALVASVAIDVDHIPQYLGWNALTEGAPRPYTHGLVTPLALCAMAAVGRGRFRAIALGAALGVCAHLLRDLATANGVALLWPATSMDVRMPYWTYVVALALAAVGIACLARGGRLTAPRLRGGTPQSPRLASSANTRHAGFGLPSESTRP
jgi:membrane-bound metal-dependent hydrolase YbcI (DUF457 family)